mmetsp:Transcript_28205/g.27033  ORF Transcript_28205/g.27033 Transcript_28205/m.27033 type:complete len:632 (-) Transcript_28205:310-2205(-)
MDLNKALKSKDTFNNKERMKGSFTSSHPGSGEGQEVLSYEVKGLSWKAGFLFLVAVASVLCLTNTKDFSSTPAAFTSSESKAHVGRLHSPDTDSIAEPGLSVVLENSANRCRSDHDCKDVKDKHICLLESNIDKPVAHHCYNCTNNNDCEFGYECAMDNHGAVCASVHVNQIPGMSKVERGYNIFKGDPYGTIKPLEDAGVAARPFYIQVHDTDPKYEIVMGKETYSMPVEFDVYNDNRCAKTFTSVAVTSEESFKEAFKESVQYEAEGSYSGIDFGASIGAEAFYNSKVSALKGTTTTDSSAHCTAYQFNLKSDQNLRLTGEVKNLLNTLNTTNENDHWGIFFTDYGTHLITKGTMGSYEKVSTSFTREKREKIESGGLTITTSANVGLDEVARVEQSGSSGAENEIVQKFNNESTNEGKISSGNLDDAFLNPGLIKMSVKPICEYIPFDNFPEININTCREQMTAFCLAQMANEGGEPSPPPKCKYEGGDRPFQCVTNKDCSGGECKEAKCTKCTKYKIQVTKYCVRDDDPGTHGEYVWSFGNPKVRYWKGIVKDRACTEREWPIVDIINGPTEFTSWELDQFSIRKLKSKVFTVGDNSGSCAIVEKTMDVTNAVTNFKDEVTVKIWGV